jgi:hypothetical protein
MTEVVDVVCAWCNSRQGTKEMQIGDTQMQGTPTHTICTRCVIEQFRGARVKVLDTGLIGRTAGMLARPAGNVFEITLEGGGVAWRKAEELELLRDQSD